MITFQNFKLLFKVQNEERNNKYLKIFALLLIFNDVDMINIHIFKETIFT